MAMLKLYNSLTRNKDQFTPIDPSHVRIYACGPTVYSYAHIGNARMAVVFDVLANILRAQYPKVTYVSNITDVDDKIITASRESGDAINVITEKYTRIYNEDMAALGVAAPDIQPLATAHIPHMIALIEKLIEADHAYAAQGHVLFHVPSFPAYGGLSGRSRDEQIAGARVEVASYKKDPADFVLWKPSKRNERDWEEFKDILFGSDKIYESGYPIPDEPGWDSPWGFGRPGWHIECSAMAQEHLGLPFDIHGGGADLKFPHHENEIAQSCCAHGHENDLSAFAKYWVHNGFVTVNGEKMSKSLGNVVLVHDLAKDYNGEVLRMTLIGAHYRQPLDWTTESIMQSKKTLDRLYQALHAMADIAPEETKSLPPTFIEALYDDLNTPKALAALSALIKEATDSKSPILLGQIYAAAKLLGILQHKPQEWLGYSVTDNSIDENHINSLLQQRTTAKMDKNFARADEIRAELTAMGIAIEDTPQGPVWKKIT